jgi:hypothetical protein
MICGVQRCPHVRAAGSKGRKEKIAKTAAETSKIVTIAKKIRRPINLTMLISPKNYLMFSSKCP